MMNAQSTVPIEKSKLITAWSVLENLAVSLHRIGSAHADDPLSVSTAESSPELAEALRGYLTSELIQQIADARTSLGSYLSDDEAESIANHIPYWEPDAVAADS